MTMPLENRRKWMRRIETEALLLPEKSVCPPVQMIVGFPYTI